MPDPRPPIRRLRNYRQVFVEGKARGQDNRIKPLPNRLAVDQYDIRELALVRLRARATERTVEQELAPTEMPFLAKWVRGHARRFHSILMRLP